MPKKNFECFQISFASNGRRRRRMFREQLLILVADRGVHKYDWYIYIKYINVSPMRSLSLSCTDLHDNTNFKRSDVVFFTDFLLLFYLVFEDMVEINIIFIL